MSALLAQLAPIATTAAVLALVLLVASVIVRMFPSLASPNSCADCGGHGHRMVERPWGQSLVDCTACDRSGVDAQW